MWGLIKKDLLVMLRRFNPAQCLVIVVVIIPMVQVPQFALLMISLVIAYLASIMVSMSFSYDAMSRWDDYAIALPFSAKQIVRAKYMMAFLFMIVTFVVIGIAYYFCKGLGIANNSDLNFALLAALFFSCTYNAIQIPIIYRFGIEIGKYSLYIMLLVPYGVLALLQLLHININLTYFSHGAGFYSLLILQILILIVSFYVSVMIYQKARQR